MKTSLKTIQRNIRQIICKFQAHVVCRMLGFTGARRAFTGCRWGTFSPSERLADSCGDKCTSPSSDNPSNHLMFCHPLLFSDLAAVQTILQWLESDAVEMSALLRIVGGSFFCML